MKEDDVGIDTACKCMDITQVEVYSRTNNCNFILLSGN